MNSAYYKQLHSIINWSTVEKNSPRFNLLHLLFFKFDQRITIFLKKCKVHIKGQENDLIVWTSGEQSGLFEINGEDCSKFLAPEIGKNIKSKFFHQTKNGYEFTIIQSYPVKIVNDEDVGAKVLTVILPENSVFFNPINCAIDILPKEINLSLVMHEGKISMHDIAFDWELASSLKTRWEFEQKHALLFKTISYMGVLQNVSIR